MALKSAKSFETHPYLFLKDGLRLIHFIKLDDKARHAEYPGLLKENAIVKIDENLSFMRMPHTQHALMLLIGRSSTPYIAREAFTSFLLLNSFFIHCEKLVAFLNAPRVLIPTVDAIVFDVSSWLRALKVSVFWFAVRDFDYRGAFQNLLHCPMVKSLSVEIKSIDEIGMWNVVKQLARPLRDLKAANGPMELFQVEGFPSGQTVGKDLTWLWDRPSDQDKIEIVNQRASPKQMMRANLELRWAINDWAGDAERMMLDFAVVENTHYTFYMMPSRRH